MKHFYLSKTVAHYEYGVPFINPELVAIEPNMECYCSGGQAICVVDRNDYVLPPDTDYIGQKTPDIPPVAERARLLALAARTGAIIHDPASTADIIDRIGKSISPHFDIGRYS